MSTIKKPSRSAKSGWAQIDFNRWNTTPQEYLILSTNGTENGSSEIVEVSLIDMNGNVLFDSLIKPQWDCVSDWLVKHDITDSILVNSPFFVDVWNEFYKLVSGKTLLCFNSVLELARIRHSLGGMSNTEFHQRYPDISFEFVSEKYASLLERKGWFAYLEDAVEQPKYRTLSDCFDILELIKKSYNPNFTEEDAKKLQLEEDAYKFKLLAQVEALHQGGN